jgi:hypothetical protein
MGPQTLAPWLARCVLTSPGPSTLPPVGAMLDRTSSRMIETADIFLALPGNRRETSRLLSRGVDSCSKNSLPIEALACRRECRGEESFVGYTFERYFFAKRRMMLASRCRGVLLPPWGLYGSGCDPSAQLFYFLQESQG